MRISPINLYEQARLYGESLVAPLINSGDKLIRNFQVPPERKPRKVELTTQSTKKSIETTIGNNFNITI